MELMIESGDYVILVEINKEVLKCKSFDDVDRAERIGYELIGRMSERLPADAIMSSVIDYIRFGSGFIGDRIIWDAMTESFFCQQFETIDGSPIGETIDDTSLDRTRVELVRYYSYLTIGKVIDFEVGQWTNTGSGDGP